MIRQSGNLSSFIAWKFNLKAHPGRRSKFNLILVGAVATLIYVISVLCINVNILEFIEKSLFDLHYIVLPLYRFLNSNIFSSLIILLH